MKYVLNETPVRTTRNFKINDINLDDINFNNIPFDGFIFSKNLKVRDISSRIIAKYNLGFENDINLNQNLEIVIDKNDNNLKLSYDFDDTNSLLLAENKIIVKEGIESTLYVKFTSESVNKYTSYLGMDIVLEKGSSLKLYVINMLNDKTDFFVKINGELSENSNLDINSTYLGANRNVVNYSVNSVGNNSVSNIKTVYIGKNDSITDINYIANLFGEKTSVNIDVNGALDDTSRKHFKGTIDFKKGAKKSKGEENEFCFLLSNKAKSIALPMLLCSEDDVEGNHSSASRKS